MAAPSGCLVRRGLIVQDPQFRIMNESFRQFLRSVTTSQMKAQVAHRVAAERLGKMHGAFFTTMIVLGALLLTHRERSLAIVRGLCNHCVGHSWKAGQAVQYVPRHDNRGEGELISLS